MDEASTIGELFEHFGGEQAFSIRRMPTGLPPGRPKTGGYHRPPRPKKARGRSKWLPKLSDFVTAEERRAVKLISLWANHVPQKQIARQLGISIRSVQRHLQRLRNDQLSRGYARRNKSGGKMVENPPINRKG
jgi:DNA invertase Pin-like site-specific DNA recombinase